MKKKRPFTLLEIMIVIFLIGLIGSIIGYNMKGSLDQGRKFKTEQAITKIQDIVELEVAKQFDEKLDVKGYLRRSGLVKNPAKMLKDGWGKPFELDLDEAGNLTITSQALNAYNEKNGLTSETDEE